MLAGFLGGAGRIRPAPARALARCRGLVPPGPTDRGRPRVRSRRRPRGRRVRRQPHRGRRTSYPRRARPARGGAHARRARVRFGLAAKSGSSGPAGQRSARLKPVRPTPQRPETQASPACTSILHKIVAKMHTSVLRLRPNRPRISGKGDLCAPSSWPWPSAVCLCSSIAEGKPLEPELDDAGPACGSRFCLGTVRQRLWTCPGRQRSHGDGQRCHPRGTDGDRRAFVIGDP